MKPNALPCLAVVFLLAFAALRLSIAEEHGPNFIIFIADDMAWDDCGAYGHPSIRTPHIDQLAAEGMRFDRAYLTCSSCSPSRCSILTGRYPHSTQAGELHLPLPPDQTLFTQALKQAGYWTAAVGKWHLGEAVADHVDFRAGSNPEKMGEAWVSALQSRPQDKPFFLWAAHSDPHRGYRPGAVEPGHTSESVRVPAFLPDVPAVRDDLALYYDEISRFDAHVGQVLAEIAHQGIAHNTFVLVMSDNGRPFPYCKTRVHVPGTRTPFVVRWPDAVPAGQVSTSLVSAVDIAPTILDLAGVPLLDSFQGHSFADILEDPENSVRKYAFAEHNWHDYRAFERATYDRDYCYVRNWLPEIAGTPPADAVKSPTFEAMLGLHAAGKLTEIQRECLITPRPTEFLFNVAADPDCLNNLADHPDSAAKLNELRNALEQWQTETNDQFPGVDALTPDGFDRTSGNRIIKAAHPSLVQP